jgi:hypothetical protein
MADTTIPGSYVSVADLTSTYTGIDFSTLQPGQVARAIQRASRWVDKICKQTLYPTQDAVTLAQNAYPECYTIDQDTGYLSLWPRFFPLQSIVSLSYQYGINLNGGTPVTVPVAYVQAFDRFYRVQTDYLGVWGQGVLWPAPLYVNLTYVNGVNIAQSQSAMTGGTTSQVTLKTVPGQGFAGFAAGSVLEIQDSATQSELVTVQSVSGNVITLTAPVVNNHAADVTLADPKAAPIQQATIDIATYLVKERGLGPVSLSGSSFEQQRGRGGMPNDLIADCEEMLEDFIAHS